MVFVSYMAQHAARMVNNESVFRKLRNQMAEEAKKIGRPKCLP